MYIFEWKHCYASCELKQGFDENAEPWIFSLLDELACFDYLRCSY